MGPAVGIEHDAESERTPFSRLQLFGAFGDRDSLVEFICGQVIEAPVMSGPFEQDVLLFQPVPGINDLGRL